MNADALRAYWIGKRVALAPHLDRWMRGDRYGDVTGVRPTKDRGVRLAVLLDSGETVVLSDDDVTEVA